MSKPIVLIHGAWHGAWCFDAISEPLRSRGYDVHAVDLPLTGTEGDIRIARDLIAAHPGAVVLGHSYGGLVITHASWRDVSHLVYLAALMPARGENIGDLVAHYPSPALLRAVTAGEDGRMRIAADLAIDAFYHDCDPLQAQQAVARLRPQMFAEFPVLERQPIWQSIPSTYVVCKDDKAQHPELQRLFAARATHTVEWDGSHSPFLARPDLVVELLAELAS